MNFEHVVDCTFTSVLTKRAPRKMRPESIISGSNTVPLSGYLAILNSFGFSGSKETWLDAQRRLDGLYARDRLNPQVLPPTESTRLNPGAEIHNHTESTSPLQQKGSFTVSKCPLHSEIALEIT